VVVVVVVVVRVEVLVVVVVRVVVPVKVVVVVVLVVVVLVAVVNQGSKTPQPGHSWICCRGFSLWSLASCSLVDVVVAIVVATVSLVDVLLWDALDTAFLW
jgi:hypothetical protein